MGSRRLTGVVVVLASLLAAACGHSDDRSTVARPTTTGPTAPTPTVTANGPAVTTGPALALPASDDWPTYHHDPARRGSVAGGPSPAGVKQHWLSPALDGTIYAEPLVVDGLVIAATEGDSVYALHVDSGQVAWQAQLGQPMRASQLPCGNIDPSGITGTPVVDVATGTVYATAFLQPGRHELVALDLHSGQVKFRRAIDPPSDDPKVLQERGALQVANGMVYVPFGGLFGDCGSYHGWIVASRLDGQGPLQSFQVPVKREGGLWAPPGP
ncbi:MAG: hypothetical protein QOG64_2913, partial [Acidimicrobiaceae bacterium]|nr:hypothetical protein [Acidimicrobiaceae bacterium]